MKIFLLLFALVFASPEKNILTGRWETKVSEKGNVTGVVFKEDSKMEVYINRKPFVSGMYTFNPTDSIISFVDNGCDGAKATYKALFYSNSDSLRFKVIVDSCEQRRNGMERTMLGRIK